MSDRDDSGYIQANSRLARISETPEVITGFTPGDFYTFTAVGGTAVCKWDAADSAVAISDGGFDFIVTAGDHIHTRCPWGVTDMSIIEAGTESAADAALYISSITP